MPCNRLFYALILFSITACKHEPSLMQSNVQPEEKQDSCGLEKVTYTHKIKAILDIHCVECHMSNRSAKGLNFEGYSSAKFWFLRDSLRIMQTIRHEYTVQMPPNIKIPDCKIRLLETWLREGLKEN